MNTLPFVLPENLEQDIAAVVAMTDSEKVKLADDLFGYTETLKGQIKDETYEKIMSRSKEFKEVLITIFKWVKVGMSHEDIGFKMFQEVSARSINK